MILWLSGPFMGRECVKNAVVRFWKVRAFGCNGRGGWLYRELALQDGCCWMSAA